MRPGEAGGFGHGNGSGMDLERGMPARGAKCDAELHGGALFY